MCFMLLDFSCLVLFYVFLCFFFFFKQKTAYEMRISDWSSDVCSSDLTTDRFYGYGEIVRPRHAHIGGRTDVQRDQVVAHRRPTGTEHTAVGQVQPDRLVVVQPGAGEAAERSQVDMEIGTQSRRARVCQNV